MKTTHLLIGGGLLLAAAFYARGASARPRVAQGGGATPYFPGESPLPAKLTNWSPELYERLGGLIAFTPPRNPPTSGAKRDATDRQPVRDVYSPAGDTVGHAAILPPYQVFLQGAI